MDLDSALDGLSVSHEPKMRLKHAVDLKKLVTEGEATFDKEELDEEMIELDAFHEDDDGQLESPFVDANSKSILVKHFGGKVGDVPKSAPTSGAIDALFSSNSKYPKLSMKTDAELEHEALLQKTILKAGKMCQKMSGDAAVLYHYILFAEGSDDPFDNSLRRNAPELCDFKNANLLLGLYLAIWGMEVGEISKFVLTPDLAYGKLGIPTLNVPEDANVLCYIEILEKVDQKSLKKTPLSITAQERATLPFQSILDCADELKLEGNEEYKKGNFENAKKKYRNAIMMLEEYPLISKDDQELLSPALSTVYSNLAQCYLKLEKPELACTACKLAIKVGNGKEDVKVLCRLAKGKFLLRKFEDAITVCDKVLELDPANSEMKVLKNEIRDELKKEDEAVAKMFQGVLQ